MNNKFNYIKEVIQNTLALEADKHEIIRDLIVWLANLQLSEIEYRESDEYFDFMGDE